jgi:hypothetical protein
MAETQQIKVSAIEQRLLRTIESLDEAEMDKKSSISISAEFWQEKVSLVKAKYPALAVKGDGAIKGALKVLFKEDFLESASKLLA